MATYYKWRKSTVSYKESTVNEGTSLSFNTVGSSPYTIYYSLSKPSVINTKYYFPNSKTLSLGDTFQISSGDSVGYTNDYNNSSSAFSASGLKVSISSNGYRMTYTAGSGSITQHVVNPAPGSARGYVYSTNLSAYPNNDVSDSYYYDQRTTVTSPTVASNLTYPESIDVTLSSSVQLQWTGAQSNTDYPVTEYEISYAINNTDSWQVAGTTGVLTYEFYSIPEEATSIAFRVRAKDSNNQYGDYVTGTYSTITKSPFNVVTKNIEMNYFNGTDYEILYPVVGSEVYNHVKSGNYVGSGQYGQSNPNKLTLEFTPKVAMITKTSGVYDAYLLNGKTVSYVQSSTGVSEITVEWTGQTVSWYSADSVEAQLNENGVLYAYVVFG